MQKSLIVFATFRNKHLSYPTTPPLKSEPAVIFHGKEWILNFWWGLPSQFPEHGIEQTLICTFPAKKEESMLLLTYHALPTSFFNRWLYNLFTNPQVNRELYTNPALSYGFHVEVSGKSKQSSFFTLPGSALMLWSEIEKPSSLLTKVEKRSGEAIAWHYPPLILLRTGKEFFKPNTITKILTERLFIASMISDIEVDENKHSFSLWKIKIEGEKIFTPKVVLTTTRSRKILKEAKEMKEQ